MSQQLPAYSAPQPQAAVVQHPSVVTMQTGQVAVAATNQPPPGNWRGIKVTGIIQVVLGALTVILGIVAVSIGSLNSNVGTGIWCGLGFYIVAGILGIVSGQKQNVGAAIGYMVMSIFACLASCVVIGFAARPISYYAYYCGPYYSLCYSAGHIAVNVMLVILGIAEFIVSIIGSSMTCSPVCYSSPSHTVIHHQPQPQVIVGGQPQNMTYYPSAAPQQQYGYPAQQVAGQFQPPPQGYQYPPQSQAQPQAQPLARADEHQYQQLNK